MKVLLISQPDMHKHKPDFPPIGIAYLGAYSFADGHETMLIDAGLSKITDIVKKAKRFAPDFIGVTCWTIGRKMTWELSAALKKELPKAFLCLGGPHATMFPEHIFIKTRASAVVIGEGEETFRELLKVLDAKEDLKLVKGLALRNNDNTVYFTGSRNYIDNLDSIPRPFYAGFEKFNLYNYYGHPCLPRPAASIISSRGCVFNCTYCSSVRFWGKQWRYRSAENVLQEMEWLVETAGAKSFFFFDDNFTVIKERVFVICEGILERKWDIKWACCSHIRTVSLELLEAMNKSGCVSIDFGVESGSDKILKNINKLQTRAEIEKTFDMVHKVGIKPRAYFMVGNIGENENSIDETIEMAGKIKPYSSIGAAILWLLPGTSVYNDAKNRGFISDDYWLNSDDPPYNLQEYSYKELVNLRKRLMLGIAKQKGGIISRIMYYLKTIYYKYPKLSFLNTLIPARLR
jgi:radical SAM superfamily enzyme YgiQ (UPF0313 family)